MVTLNAPFSPTTTRAGAAAQSSSAQELREEGRLGSLVGDDIPAFIPALEVVVGLEKLGLVHEERPASCEPMSCSEPIGVTATPVGSGASGTSNVARDSVHICG